MCKPDFYFLVDNMASSKSIFNVDFARKTAISTINQYLQYAVTEIIKYSYNIVLARLEEEWGCFSDEDKADFQQSITEMLICNPWRDERYDSICKELKYSNWGAGNDRSVDELKKEMIKQTFPGEIEGFFSYVNGISLKEVYTASQIKEIETLLENTKQQLIDKITNTN